MNKEKMIEVKDLKLYFDGDYGTTQILNGITFDIHTGETLGIVGESGCGKSQTAMSIMRLSKALLEGEINFKGQNVLTLPMREMRKIRGNEISMIFQDPMTCLNPVFTIGHQLSEVFRLHQGMNKAEAWNASIEALHMVNVAMPEKRVKDYPYQMSGGMRQRVMIASALACKPSLLIADEPTTALDVTIQAQILELIGQMKEREKAAVLLITHDMGVVAGLAQRIVIMYAGCVVETGTTAQIFYEHKHPYTEALLRSLPSADAGKREPLMSIPGTPPDLLCPPKGCGFAARCRHCMQICREEQPPEFELGDGHKASCWLLHPDCPCAAERGDDQ